MRNRLDPTSIESETEKSPDSSFQSLFPKTLFDSIQEGIIVLDSSGTILDCNREVVRHLDSDPKILIGQNCLNLVRPEDQRLVGEFISDCIKNKGAVATFRLAANTGKLRILESHGSYVEHDGKEYIICWIEDITQKSFSFHKWIFHDNADRMTLSPSAELAAIENVCQSLGFLLDSHRVFVTGITPTQNLRTTLIDCEYTASIDQDSMIGQELPSDGLDFVDKSAKFASISFSVPDNLEMYGKTIRSYGVQAMLVHRITQIEGRDVFLHVCRKTDDPQWHSREINAISAATKSIGEILEWTRLSNLADTAEQQFRFLFQHVPYPLLLVENDATIYDFNKAASELFSLSVNQSKKINILELFPEGESVNALEFLNKIQTEKKAVSSGRMRTLNGKVFHYEISGVPFFQSMSLLQVTDVSDKRELDEQLFNMQKMDSIGIMAREIANDFNNLLGGMLGYISLLRTSDFSGADSDTVQVFDKMEEAAKKGAGLTEKLLSLSSNKQGETETIDLGELVQKTATENLPNHDQPIEQSFIFPEEKVYINGNRFQIVQIVTNLLQNAAEAMPDGGSLKMTLKESQSKKTLLSAYPNIKPGPYLELIFSDTGIGMKHEVRQRIFEPFFSTKSGNENSGMGMSVVYANVRNHKGFIRVRSFPKVGTTVRLFLPKAIPSLEISPRNMKKDTNQRQPSVLIVDDEELIRDMASRFLDRMGCRSVCANNGLEAVRLFSESPDKFDLVLMDIVMPSMDGREAALKIKQIEPEAKILFSSGYSHDNAFLESIQHASTGFLAKPYQLDEFLSAISQALKLDESSRLI